MYGRPKEAASKKESQNRLRANRRIGPGGGGGGGGGEGGGGGRRPRRRRPARPRPAAPSRLPRRAGIPPPPGPAQNGGSAAAAQPVPSPAPWALSAHRTGLSTRGPAPRSEAAQAAREGLCRLQRGAGGGGGRLP
ncbi:uncharacterized protein MT2145-like [Manis pentadactyla]|uniref:uncharacterized protein MT2145-like n=1 Tax=Manis pentadactyla TaxID=143292 RepID=UPI00255D036E|nr:uncharacterized protein MT2145-like [Manis pentadactyla]